MPVAASADAPSRAAVLTPAAPGAVVEGWHLPVLGPPGRTWTEGRSKDAGVQVLVEDRPGSPLGTGAQSGPGARTRFMIVRTDGRGRVVGRDARRIIDLGGTFGYDAISNTGATLFLTELLDGRGAYRVRMVDTATGRLDPRVVTEQRLDSEAYAEGSDDPMFGDALARVRNPQRSHWIFTLYDAPGRHPFVHALNTEGWALCVDLPRHAQSYADSADRWTMEATSETVTVSNDVIGRSWSFAVGTTTLQEVRTRAAQ